MEPPQNPGKPCPAAVERHQQQPPQKTALGQRRPGCCRGENRTDAPRDSTDGPVPTADPANHPRGQQRHPLGVGMGTLTLLVPGMSCRHCVRKVTAALRDVPGVQLVQADLTNTTVVLHGEPAVGDVVAALDRAGFPGTVIPAHGESRMPTDTERAEGA